MIGAALLLAFATPAPAATLPAQEAVGAVPWLAIGEPSPAAEAQAAWKDLQAAGIAPARLVATGLAGLRPLAFHVAGGHRHGEWTFFFEDGEARPAGAWRLKLPTQLPYRVDARLYCEADVCEQLQARLRALPAPPVANAGDGGLYRAWSEIVRHEPCDPTAPPRQAQPRYPNPARREGLAGRVELQFFHNACGDVRDVSVRQSSGHALLDAAAVAQVRRWRIAPEPPGTAGHARVGVTFRLEDDVGPATSAPAP